LSNEFYNEKQNSLEFELIYENPEEKTEFTSYLSFKDGSSYKVSIYGFLYNGIMFLSEVSQDKAILKAYLDDLENSNIDQETYEILVQELSNEAIANENISIVEDLVVMDTILSGNTYINGTLEWEDNNGNLHPLQFITVEVWDDDTLFDEKLGTITTCTCQEKVDCVNPFNSSTYFYYTSSKLSGLFRILKLRDRLYLLVKDFTKITEAI